MDSKAVFVSFWLRHFLITKDQKKRMPAFGLAYGGFELENKGREFGQELVSGPV